MRSGPTDGIGMRNRGNQIMDLIRDTTEFPIVGTSLVAMYKDRSNV
jgi:hypothetical protein